MKLARLTMAIAAMAIAYLVYACGTHVDLGAPVAPSGDAGGDAASDGG